MGEIIGSLREVLAAAVGHAALYGDAAAHTVQELKAHWLRRIVWSVVGLLLLHAALIGTMALGALAVWYQAWPSGWAWLLCVVPAMLGALALWHAWRHDAPPSLLIQVASEDAQWLRALVERPPEDAALSEPAGAGATTAPGEPATAGARP